MAESTTPLQIFIAPPDFEKDLENEILYLGGLISDRRGRLLVGHCPRPPAFAQNIWHTPKWINFTSIKEGADQLKKLAPLWALHSSAHHRRAELIQRQLKPLPTKKLDFPMLRQWPSLGAWTLWEPNKILASPSTSSAYPDGEPQFNLDTENAPSRAYQKLWEWMTVTQKFPQPHELCLDLGSCPGGWTWVISRLGAKVISVDKAPLDSRLKSPLIRWLKKDAFTMKPDDLEPIDWLFSDIICYPPKLFDLVQVWRQSGRVKNFVCTIKFQGETDFATLQKFREIPGSNILHLSANKHEVTWYLLETK
jgi:23S rRNA (cytidine2498-2'-O)-methyltransferase